MLTLTLLSHRLSLALASWKKKTNQYRSMLEGFVKKNTFFKLYFQLINSIYNVFYFKQNAV